MRTQQLAAPGWRRMGENVKELAWRRQNTNTESCRGSWRTLALNNQNLADLKIAPKDLRTISFCPSKGKSLLNTSRCPPCEDHCAKQHTCPCCLATRHSNRGPFFFCIGCWMSALNLAKTLLISTPLKCLEREIQGAWVASSSVWVLLPLRPRSQGGYIKPGLWKFEVCMEYAWDFLSSAPSAPPSVCSLSSSP